MSKASCNGDVLRSMTGSRIYGQYKKSPGVGVKEF